MKKSPFLSHLAPIVAVLMLSACQTTRDHVKTPTVPFYRRAQQSINHGASAVGDSLAHGATAARIGYSAVVSGVSFCQITVTTTGSVTFTAIAFTNRQPWIAPLKTPTVTIPLKN